MKMESKMNKTSLEKEVKFYINDLPALRERLLSLGAVMTQPRTHETNYRFDTPDLSLSRSGRALRLRHDQRNILTFKGPASTEAGVRVRPEFEVEVDSMENAQSILEGLGYILTVSYEKWRAVYQYNDLEITLDELPYGNFSEIEGTDTAAIRAAASVLSLDWEARVQASYLELFDHLKKNLNLSVQNLTFKDFSTIPVTCLDLGVKPADTPAFL